MATKIDIFNKAKKLIFIDTEPSESDLELLETVADMTCDKVLSKIKVELPLQEEMPLELTTTVTELIIIRFNRIGSEGLKKEMVEGHSSEYSFDDEGVLWQEIRDWIDANIEPAFKARIRFL